MRTNFFHFTYSFLLIVSFTMTAQNKQLTLQDLLPGGKTYKHFVPQTLEQIQWCGDTYLYVTGDSVMLGTPNKKETLAFTRKQLNDQLLENKKKEVGKLPSFSIPFQEEPIVAFTIKSNRIHYNFKEQKIVAIYELAKDWKNFDFCSANSNIAFTQGNNLQIISPENTITIITKETDKEIVYGQAVHQREFGINKGTFWSPQGSALAFYRMDERMVTDYPFVNIDARCAKAEPHKYPMAGMKSHEVTIGIYNLSSGKTVWLQTGLPKEKYLTNITWSPDEKFIYIAELNREQNEMQLVRYSAETGNKDTVLFTETDERYVEPQHSPLFLPGQSDKFIWQSERDGYNHLYLYNTSGKLLKQLTSGKWVVTDILGFDKNGNTVFIKSTEAFPLEKENFAPLESYAWKINLKTGKRSCLNEKKGVHDISLSPDGLYIIDQTSSPVMPKDIDIIRTKDKKKTASLLSAKDPFGQYIMPKIEVGKIKAADGITDLYYRLVKPADLDENKKYPTIVYVYGGPHAQLITGNWLYGVRGWDLYMAQKGYIVFTLDGRGSANRGHAFESVIHRNLGINEMADQIKGVEYLKSLPYIDTDRIGVHGWSYGGFMANLMLSYPDIFKVGVAGGPVIDWSHYEIMYGERYMDRPQDNPEGYKNANLKLKAGNLKGHLLLIHGDIDPVVVWQHSLGFLKACVDADTYPDYFVYPRHEHNVIGKDRPHLYEKVTRYFDDYLK